MRRPAIILDKRYQGPV